MKKATEIMQIINHKIDTQSILMFDLDGTLVNSNYVNYLAYKEAIWQILKLDLNSLYDSSDRFTRTVLEMTVPRLTPIEYENIIELKNKLYEDYLHKTTLNDFVVKILKKYSKTNKTILVTNSHKKRAVMILKHHGLMNIFNHKFYKEDKDNGEEISKFKYVLTHLKILPTSVVIFENEKSEVDTAILSGIPTENIISISFTNKGKNNYE